MKINVGKVFNEIIEAYGLQFGMTRDEMATFLMRRAVDDIIRSKALCNAHSTMKLVKEINQTKAGQS